MSHLAEHTEAPAPSDGGTGEGLELRGLTKDFGAFKAVDDLDLDVPSGSFFALLGPSGCGKTTTLRMVAGLETPTSGTIRLAAPRHHVREALPPAGQHRLPELRALPPPRHLRERRLRPPPPQGDRRRRRGPPDARPGRARHPGPQAADAALGWPAAARRPRPGTDQQARGAAARRAAGCPRPQAAPPDADRAQADPDRGQHDVHPRHPRPGGGHDHGRHHRGDERRGDRADGCSRRALREPPHHLRGELPRSVQPDRRPDPRPARAR